MLQRANLKQQDGNWLMQKTPLPAIAAAYPTPFYLYDGDWLINQYRNFFRFITWQPLRVFYAMKANYNTGLLKLLAGEGCSIDAVSPAEVLLALQTGYAPERILFTANNITDAEMHLVQAQGVLFNIDSLSRLEKYGQAYPGSRVCLRFNPGVEAGENAKVQTGGDKTKFGILLNAAKQAAAIAGRYNLKIVGIHKHTGSGIAASGQFRQALENLLSVADNQCMPHLEFIDLGGGFKVPYHESEAPVDYAAFGSMITDALTAFCLRYGRHLELRVEPGKYLTAECGLLMTRVNTLKENAGRLIAGCDTGFNHLIRPVLYNAYHPILNVSNPAGRIRRYDVCGNLCETGDCFARDRDLPEIREGDYLALLNAGAYGYAMAGVYNLRPLPSEVIHYRGTHRLVTKQLTPAQLAAKIAGESLWET